MPVEQLRELQLDRMKRSFAHAYENIPLYRERFAEAGVVPSDLKSLDDLVKFPFLTKQDMRDSYPFGLFAVSQGDVARIHASSGTTGQATVVGHTANDLKNWGECFARGIYMVGGSRDSVIQVSYGYGLFTGGLGAHQGAGRLGATVIPMSSGNTQRQIMMIKELGATMLCCTPSYALYLGESIREAGIPVSDLKLKAGCFGAEPWTEEMRKQIEELLGINAYDVYGLTEIAGPGVGFECVAKHGMHVSEDHVIPEIIDPVTEQPLPYRTPGELVFTTITKEGMPMLRYRTHDICTLDDTPCECGRTLVRMGRITGRTDDMIVVRGVNVFPTQIESVLVGLEGVAPHYLLVVDRVHSADTLEVQVELVDGSLLDSFAALEELTATIRAKLRVVLGIDAKVKLVGPKTIERFAGGKAKRIVDLRDMH